MHLLKWGCVLKESHINVGGRGCNWFLHANVSPETWKQKKKIKWLKVITLLWLSKNIYQSIYQRVISTNTASERWIIQDIKIFIVATLKFWISYVN